MPELGAASGLRWPPRGGAGECPNGEKCPNVDGCLTGSVASGGVAALLGVAAIRGSAAARGCTSQEPVGTGRGRVLSAEAAGGVRGVRVSRVAPASGGPGEGSGCLAAASGQCP